MSFIDSVGTLMNETGMADVLTPFFGGVAKMLIGKKFPQNVRALRLMTEEVLKHILAEQHFKSTDELIAALKERAHHSKTVKLWVDVLVKISPANDELRSR